MRIRRRFDIVATMLVAFAALFAVCFDPSAARADTAYLVDFNTSAVASGTVGYLDFQFNPGGPTADAATATISNFSFINLTFNSSTPSGGGSGALPGPLSIKNSTGFNEVLENVTFGANSGFSFLLTFSGPAVNSPNPSATDGTSFGVGVLNSSFNPLYDSHDPVLR